MEFDRLLGKHIQAAIAWVHFVSLNPDVMAALIQGPLKLQRIAEGRFVGRFFSLAVEIEREREEYSGSKGQHGSLADVYLPLHLGGTYVRIRSTYYTVESNVTSFEMSLILKPRGFIHGYLWFNRRKIGKYIDQLCAHYETAARLLEQDDPILKTSLNADQRQRIDEYRRKSARLSATEKSDARCVAASLSVSLVHDVMVLAAEALLPDREVLSGRSELPIGEGIGEFLKNGFQQLAAIHDPARAVRGMRGGESVNADFRQAAFEFGHRLYRHCSSGDLAGLLPVLVHHGRRTRLQLEIAQALENIPWEALHDGQDFLALKLRLARSLGSLAESGPAGTIRSVRGFLIIGADSMGDLPGAEYEAEQIGHILRQAEIGPVEVLCGTQANRRRVMEILASAEFNVLHFSGHSIFDPDHPRQSHLKLTHGTQLFLDDLRYLCRPAEGISRLQLVFLNACESGRTGIDAVTGRGQNMCRLLREAGVANVIGMLWKVADDAAVEVATVFYRSLIEHDSDAAEAMRLTRRKVAMERAWADGSWLAPVLYI